MRPLSYLSSTVSTFSCQALFIFLLSPSCHTLSLPAYLISTYLPCHQMIVRRDAPSSEPTIPPPPPPTLFQIWQDAFHRTDYVAFLRNEAVATVLRSRPFRSVSWRLFLGALPEDRSTWATALAESRREYNELRTSLAVDPRGPGDADNHPLTAEEKVRVKTRDAK